MDCRQNKAGGRPSPSPLPLHRDSPPCPTSKEEGSPSNEPPSSTLPPPHVVTATSKEEGSPSTSCRRRLRSPSSFTCSRTTRMRGHHLRNSAILRGGTRRGGEEKRWVGREWKRSAAGAAQEVCITRALRGGPGGREGVGEKRWAAGQARVEEGGGGGCSTGEVCLIRAVAGGPGGEVAQ